MAHAQVGSLIHVHQTLEDDHSIPKLPILKGPNVFGRDCFKPVSDKRLSRKHFTLIASLDGTADIVVEGTNPVVVNSGGRRNKLCIGEKGSIRHEDIIELIPGHHFYKYVALAAPSKSKVSLKGEDLSEVKGPKPKRLRPYSENEVRGTNLKGEVKCNILVEEKYLLSRNSGYGQSSRNNSIEAIRHFVLPDDKLSLTFRLLQVQSLPAWANTSSVSIGDVIQGNVLIAILSNYMVDIDWLLSACPTLIEVPNVLVIHGEGDGTLEHMKRKKPASWILHKPPLPISYGTHHSKAMILVYPRGVRIIVHTANLIYVDWNNKTQGLWMQDFPWKDQNNPSTGCGFENDLVDYLNALKWPEFTATLPALGNFKINSSFFKKFDYSSSMFSSLGSLDEKWMTELASSMSSGLSEDKKPLGLGESLIIWPTVEDVRCSLEGYAAGNAIPSPQKNVDKKFLKKYWAKWKASHTGRCRAMPHIKSYVRYNGQSIAWLLLTSANLSKAAWGALQKNNSQLMIRSYELGVLFLPSTVKPHGLGFSCTDDGSSFGGKNGTTENFEGQRTKLVTLAWQGDRNTNSSSLVVPLPVPYELPPQPYSSEDVPWSWDGRYTKKDVYGQGWPRHVQLYASQD